MNFPRRRKTMKEEATNDAGPVDGSKEHLMDAVSMATRKITVGNMIEIIQRSPMGTRRLGRETRQLLKGEEITMKEKGNLC